MNFRLLANSLMQNLKITNQITRHGSFNASKPIGKLEQYTSNYEVTNSSNEWKYVQMLLAPKIVPKPIEKSEYPSGWKMQSENAVNYPYFVSRNKNYMQPVYLIKKTRGMRKLTCLRRIQGDIWTLEKELKTFLESQKNQQIPTHINELSGTIKFRGDHVNAVKEWLDSKGL